jgi:hypothetical protein
MGRRHDGVTGVGCSSVVRFDLNVIGFDRLLGILECRSGRIDGFDRLVDVVESRDGRLGWFTG